MTAVEEGSELSGDIGLTQPCVLPPRKQKNSKRTLSKNFSDYSPSQQLSIQRLRLWFLRNCRYLKRPSPSLRSKAATIVESPEMFRNLSILESQNLELAIKAKDLQINELRGTISSDEPQLTLPPNDVKSLKKHYISKIEFNRTTNS